VTDAVQLILAPQPGSAKAPDGEVVAVVEEAQGWRTALIGFGGLGWVTRAWLSALAAKGGR